MKIDFNNPLHKLILAGLLAACTLLLTIVVAIPIPQMSGAYINLGDVGVYLCAFLLGFPWGALAAAAGSCLADILLGSALYALPTFIIKGLMALFAAYLFKRMPSKFFFVLLLAGLLMPLGYFLFEAALYGAAAALAGVPLNLVQYAAGVALGGSVLKLAKFLKLPEPPNR